jgi:hypothetical protein
VAEDGLVGAAGFYRNTLRALLHQFGGHERPSFSLFTKPTTPLRQEQGDCDKQGTQKVQPKFWAL